MKKYEKIDTIEDLKKFISEFFISDKKYFFRGQGKAEWKIKSSYIRKGNNPNRSNAVYVFQKRIEYIKEHGIEKSNLNILAEIHIMDLKHY